MLVSYLHRKFSCENISCICFPAISSMCMLIVRSVHTRVVHFLGYSDLQNLIIIMTKLPLYTILKYNLYLDQYWILLSSIAFTKVINSLHRVMWINLQVTCNKGGMRLNPSLDGVKSTCNKGRSSV